MGHLHHVAVVAAAIAVVLLAVFSVHLALAGGDVRRARDGFRRTMEAFGAFMGRTILTAAYFTFVAPFALVARTKNPMRVRGPARWLPRSTRDATLDDVRRPY